MSGVRFQVSACLWLLVAGYWLLVTGYWQLVSGQVLRDTRCGLRVLSILDFGFHGSYSTPYRKILLNFTLFDFEDEDDDDDEEDDFSKLNY